jgi:hypothetical protein
VPSERQDIIAEIQGILVSTSLPEGGIIFLEETFFPCFAVMLERVEKSSFFLSVSGEASKTYDFR